MSTYQLDQEIDNLKKKLEELSEEDESNFRDLMMAMDDPSSGLDLNTIIARQDELMVEQQELRNHYWRLLNFRASLYKRPSGWITKHFTRVLGPLPENMVEIDPKSERSQEIIKSLPSYNATALTMLFMVIGVFIGLSVAFPGLLISPLSLFMTATDIGGGEAGHSVVMNILFTVIAIVAIVMMIFNRNGARKFVFNAALNEEMWFRSGAENWTIRQRFVSCVSFGFCHVINLVYPVVTLVALSLVGAVLMAVYLAEFKRSRDVERATLASAKLHAVYNHYAFGLVVVVIALVAVATFII